MTPHDRLKESNGQQTVEPVDRADVSQQVQETPSAPVLSEQLEKDPTPEERLRALVLSIDPRATFVTPDPTDSKKAFHGVVVATLDDDLGFAQHIGRGVYALHPSVAPADHGKAAIEVKYSEGKAIARIGKGRKGQGRAD